MSARHIDRQRWPVYLGLQLRVDLFDANNEDLVSGDRIAFKNYIRLDIWLR